MNKKTKLPVLGMMVVTVCLIVFTLVARRTRSSDVKKIVSEHATQVQVVSNEWSRLGYISITNSSFRSQLEAFINSYLGQSLESGQRGRLADEVVSFVNAYSQGTYDSYKTFRMPIDFEWKEMRWVRKQTRTLDQALTEGCTIALPAAYHRWTSDVRGKTSDLSKKTMEDKFRIYLGLYSGPEMYRGYFTGIAFEKSRIELLQPGTNVISKPWTTKFASQDTNATPLATADAPFANLGYFSQKSYTFITFKDKIEAIQSSNGAVTIADCLLFVKREDGTTVPLILRVYWEPKIKRWLPDDLVVCNMEQKGTVWPLF